MQRFIFVTLLVFTIVCRADTPTIAVASNLTQPMNRIIEIYTTETGITPRASFGSSGNFARQIVQGAPYELFISASYEYVDFLLSQKAID
ncbi:MAG: substrate-binding domain-containing protein, partial [Gammaproteobacteria bacterium]